MTEQYTAQQQYWIPILQILARHNGSARTRVIRAEILRTLGDIFQPNDYDQVSKGSRVEPRWWNMARHAAEQMRKVKNGQLEHSIKSTIWVITEKGRLHLSNAEGPISKIHTELTEEDADFSNEESYNLEGVDRRELVERQIRARRGQRQFRDALRSRFDNMCCVTGCRIVAILEAAHIIPYRGHVDNNPTNGLLLRADIHTLFDLNLLGIEPGHLEIQLHPSVATEYVDLAGQTLRCTIKTRPSLVALEARYKQFNQRR